jgi:CheY-like chemotaxis protein
VQHSSVADRLRCQALFSLFLKYGVRYTPFVPPAARSKTVLIVEDDAATRTMYREALTYAGYEVIAVEDGLDALRRIEETLPAVVVLDLMLPRLGGWDVYKELRANPRTRRLPVVIVTASEARELDPSALRRFLRKPISPEALTAMVDRAVRGRPIREHSARE